MKFSHKIFISVVLETMHHNGLTDFNESFQFISLSLSHFEHLQMQILWMAMTFLTLPTDNMPLTYEFTLVG